MTALLRFHSRIRLYVPPIAWITDHLQLLECYFRPVKIQDKCDESRSKVTQKDKTSQIPGDVCVWTPEYLRQNRLVHLEYKDVIVAANVLHATAQLRTTMEHTRKLLRPGGFLVMMEVTGDMARLSFIMGGLPGWWLGVDDGRSISPCIEPPKWETLLKNNGFSGLDSIVPHRTSEPIPLCIILGQALDDRVNFLRNPLSPSNESLHLRELTVLGGKTSRTNSCITTLKLILGPYWETIRQVDALNDLNKIDLSFSRN